MLAPPVLRSKRDFRLPKRLLRGKETCCLHSAHSSIAFYVFAVRSCNVFSQYRLILFVVSNFLSCRWQLSYLSPKSSCSTAEREKKGVSVEWECQEYTDPVYLISFPFCAHMSPHSTLLQFVEKPRTSF